MSGQPLKHIIAFLPWLELPKRVAIGPVTFMPFQDAQGNVQEEFLNDMKTILTSYKDIEGSVRKNCTVICLNKRNPEWQLIRDQDEEVVLLATRILAVAVISTNEYFKNNRKYGNASIFQPVFQGFHQPIKNVALMVRRRDGFTRAGGYEHGKINIVLPLECYGLKNVQMDSSFAQALWKSHECTDGSAQRIVPALSFFCLASTDSELMDPRAEIILMTAAFEQAFGIEGQSKAYSLSCKLGELLRKYGSVHVKEARGKRAGIQLKQGYEPTQMQWYVHKKWIEELYHLRNEYVHGTRTRKKWGWKPLEHLVMSSYIFPLALKLLLSNNKLYTLTREDEKRCDSVDQLLAEPNWDKQWSQIACKMSCRSKTQSIEKVRQRLRETNDAQNCS